MSGGPANFGTTGEAQIGTFIALVGAYVAGVRAKFAEGWKKMGASAEKRRRRPAEHSRVLAEADDAAGSAGELVGEVVAFSSALDARLYSRFIAMVWHKLFPSVVTWRVGPVPFIQNVTPDHDTGKFTKLAEVERWTGAMGCFTPRGRGEAEGESSVKFLQGLHLPIKPGDGIWAVPIGPT